MANGEIRLTSMSVVEAERRIEEIFMDVFGEDDIRTIVFENHPVVKSKSYGESVEIFSEDGDTVVDTSDAGGTIVSRVKSLSSGGSSVQTAAGEDMFGGESMQDLDGDVEVFDDDSIRFKPNFLKQEAGYRWPTDGEYDGTHEKCRSCAHFIEGGGCHIVQGDIDKEGYCEQFYADLGVYGHDHGDYVEENLIIWGLDFNWDMEGAKEFANDIVERIEEKIRG